MPVKKPGGPLALGAKLDICRYRGVAAMSDLLIRNVPDNVVAAIDARAKRLGISRNEYLRRRLTQESTSSEGATVEDLRTFGSTFADLADESIMDAAWR
jgi:plasmid stability protein